MNVFLVISDEGGVPPTPPAHTLSKLLPFVPFPPLFTRTHTNLTLHGYLDVCWTNSVCVCKNVCAFANVALVESSRKAVLVHLAAHSYYGLHLYPALCGSVLCS